MELYLLKILLLRLKTYRTKKENKVFNYNYKTLRVYIYQKAKSMLNQRSKL